MDQPADQPENQPREQDADQTADDQLLHELRVRGTAPDPGEAKVENEGGEAKVENESGEAEVENEGGEAGDGLVEAASKLVELGFAIRRRSVLMLTTAGRAEADVRFCLTGTPEAAAIQAAYDRFLPLNRALIQICNDWQVRAGGVPNDHQDPVYDWAVIDRLVAHDGKTGPVLRSLGCRVSRFAQYRDRLRGARRHVEVDEHDWLLSPRVDSYHTVWMQLHEDLLLGLGLLRAQENADD